jgi:hypothetical protein
MTPLKPYSSFIVFVPCHKNAQNKFVFPLCFIVAQFVVKSSQYHRR